MSCTTKRWVISKIVSSALKKISFISSASNFLQPSKPSATFKLSTPPISINWVSQLTAHNNGISEAEVTVTHSAPPPKKVYLHPSFMRICTSNQSDTPFCRISIHSSVCKLQRSHISLLHVRVTYSCWGSHVATRTARMIRAVMTVD